MSENSRRYIEALYILDAVAKRVPPDAWDNQTCCSDWTAREVAGHASWVTRSIGSTTGAFDSPERQPEAEVAGDDPAAAIAAAVAATHAALDTEGALQTVAETPVGVMPVDSFIGTIWVDALTHAWDIADATGLAHGISDEMAIAAKASLEPISDVLRGPGRFDDPIEGGPDPVAAFIGFTGRRSVRS